MGHVYGFLLNADERLELLTNTVGQTDACREFFDGVCKANVNGKKKTTPREYHNNENKRRTDKERLRLNGNGKTNKTELVTTKNDNQSKTRLKESAEPNGARQPKKAQKPEKWLFSLPYISHNVHYTKQRLSKKLPPFSLSTEIPAAVHGAPGVFRHRFVKRFVHTCIPGWMPCSL